MDDTKLLSRSLDDAKRIMDGIRPEQLDDPTPCEDFTVRQLVAHLVEGHEMMAACLDGGEQAESPAWDAVRARLAAAADLGKPDDVVELPYGEFTREIVVQQALGETAIHAADLARATGQSLGDDAIYERVFEVVNEGWRVEGVLAPELPAPAGASLADRVLAFAGRKI